MAIDRRAALADGAGEGWRGWPGLGVSVAEVKKHTDPQDGTGRGRRDTESVRETLLWATTPQRRQTHTELHHIVSDTIHTRVKPLFAWAYNRVRDT
jgi:hypothetical protein